MKADVVTGGHYNLLELMATTVLKSQRTYSQIAVAISFLWPEVTRFTKSQIQVKPGTNGHYTYSKYKLNQHKQIFMK